MLSDQYLDSDLFAERQAVWTERLAAPARSQHVVVAQEQGRLVGFASAFGAHDPEHGTLLDNLHLKQSYRGGGICAALLRASD